MDLTSGLRDALPPGVVSPAVVAAALGDANLVVLLCAIAHLTGESALLDRYGACAFDRGRGPGRVSDADADAIRAAALEALTRPASGGHAPASRALLLRIMTFCAGEEIAEDYLPLVLEEADFDGNDPRRLAWKRPSSASSAGFHVGIIGAGLGGLCAAIRLEQAGIRYTVIEKNADVGGTWFENTYPGLRVDVPSHFYSYSFAPNPDWSDHYARRDELADYAARCARDAKVVPHIRFGTEVRSADFNEARSCWVLSLRTPDGSEDTLEVNAVISAVGLLNRPSTPDLDGIEDFDGHCFHSARWDHTVDMVGRRVAVIGTGASAMQLVPEIAREVDHLVVVQRSRHWVTPNPSYLRSVSDGEKWCLRHVPYYAGWHRFLMFWNTGDRMYPAFRVDPDWPDPETAVSRPNDKLRRLMTAYVEHELAGRPELIDDVLPDYPALGKRILQDNGWFQALLRDNVRLINDTVARVGPHSIVTGSGEEFDVDLIVLATGFLPNKFLWPMKITGRGVVLEEVWGDDPRAYLGITMPGFPNLFCLYGPNTNPVVGSVVFMLECQVRYVVKCIAALIEGGHAAMECRQDAHDGYNARVDAEHEQLVWRHPKVHSYYNNSHGRVTTNAPWRLLDYWKMTAEPDPSDFLITPPGPTEARAC